MNDDKLENDEVTAAHVYLNRRNFLRGGLLAGTTIGSAAAYRFFNPAPQRSNADDQPSQLPKPSALGQSLADPPTSLEEIVNYNNFYEFSTDKSTVAKRAENFVTSPWSVEVSGLVESPAVFSIEDLLNLEHVERVYRMRCVEAWSMVIPWRGFMLQTLLQRVRPLANARYVAFESYYDPAQMQSSFAAGIEFPYVEGLRLDEAMHPLTILATGIYGKKMPNQNGAPIRLVVPWKYGFKGIKSIAKISLTENEPPSTWNLAGPDEYGFYSNVNPDVDHPRWSQSTERRIGELKRRNTLLFNGYADEVASMYEGMDLKKYF